MQEKPLSARADELGKTLLGMVLASGTVLRRATGLSPDQYKTAMRDLKNAQLVESAELGALVRTVRRYWLTEEGLSRFGASEEQRSWHGWAGVGRLVRHDMPKVESVYAVAEMYATGGRTISAVHFVERGPMCALVELAVPGVSWPAYVVVTWATPMDTESEMFYRLKAIPKAVAKLAMDPTADCSPAALAIVGSSEWRVARTLTMACAVLNQWVPGTHITAAYYRDGEWWMSDGLSVLLGRRPRGSPLLLPPVLVLRPVASVRKQNEQSARRLMARYLWSGRGGQKLLELLTLLGEHPMGAVGHYRAVAGEAKKGKRTEERMALLANMGLVEVVTKGGRAKAGRRLRRGVPLTLSGIGQGADRYRLSQKGRSNFCFFHGGSPGDLPARTNLGRLWTKIRDKRTKEVVRVEDRWPYRHEDVVLELRAQFGQGGCRFAPGWQARTALPHRKGLDPDGKVLLKTRWGRQWWNLEVELSATSPSALRPRCGKYGWEERRDDDPVLFVVPDERAEENLHKAAKEFNPPPRILTATLGRLRKHGPFGTGAWSYYGEAVEVAGPDSEEPED